MTSGGLLWTR